MTGRKNNVPLEKLVSSIMDTKKYLEAVITKSDPESLNAAFLELREKMKGDSEDNAEMTPTLKNIISELQKYPGFQRDFLSYLKLQISSAEKLGVLDKYKEIPPPQLSKKTKNAVDDKQSKSKITTV